MSVNGVNETAAQMARQLVLKRLELTVCSYEQLDGSIPPHSEKNPVGDVWCKKFVDVRRLSRGTLFNDDILSYIYIRFFSSLYS